LDDIKTCNKPTGAHGHCGTISRHDHEGKSECLNQEVPMSLLDELESEMREIMAGRETSPIAVLIREALARHRMSRATLADKAKISLSALEKGLSGQRPLSETTVIRLEDVLGVSLRGSSAATAPDELGGYARATVSWLEGNYLTIRPASRKQGGLFTYTTIISWDEVRHCAYAQKGDVAVPHQTGHIYFNTNRHGQHRLMIMQRQTLTGEMFGILLTLQQDKGASLRPVSMPVAMVPIASLKHPPFLGVVGDQHKLYVEYAMALKRVEADGFAQVMKV
jgi:transcriptional regulator with XRE-family HTH domain